MTTEQDDEEQTWHKQEDMQYNCTSCTSIPGTTAEDMEYPVAEE